MTEEQEFLPERVNDLCGEQPVINHDATAALAIDRDEFEAWYCHQAARNAGLTFFPADISKLRDGNAYRREYGALNGKWEAWQALRPLIAVAVLDGSSARKTISTKRVIKAEFKQSLANAIATLESLSDDASCDIGAAIQEGGRPTEQDFANARSLSDQVAAVCELAGQRDTLLDALKDGKIWLHGALECKSWHWEADQREAATFSLGKIRDAIRSATGEA